MPDEPLALPHPPANFSFVPSVGTPVRLTVYVGIDRIGRIDPIICKEFRAFRAFDPANEPIGLFPDVEAGATALQRKFSEAARMKAGGEPTPTRVRDEPIYSGDLLIGRMDVWNDGRAAVYDASGKFLDLSSSAELARKACLAEHNRKIGSNSLN